MITPIGVFVFIRLLLFTKAKYFTLEGEDFVLKREKAWIYQDSVVTRSRASQQKSIHLYQNDVLRFEFCLPGFRDIEIFGVRYSNDGPTDEINIKINRKMFATTKLRRFLGRSASWNDFLSTGQLGKQFTLGPGKHSITVNVSQADKWGAEIDVIIFRINDENLSEKAFTCSLFCFEDINYSQKFIRRDDVSSARFEKIKRPAVSCTVDNNVRVAVYHDKPQRLQISASGPKYKSFKNNGIPDLSSCNFASPIWEFENVSFDPYRNEIEGPYVLMQFSGSYTTTVLVMTFVVSHLSQAQDEDNVNIGSNLYVKISDVPNGSQLLVSYIGKVRTWTDISKQAINGGMNNWTIPDRTWVENNENLIRLTLFSPFKAQQMPQITLIGLEKRKKNVITNTIFNDEDFIIDTIDYDVWWKFNKSISVHVLDDKVSYSGVECLEVSSKNEWSDQGHSKVMRICQDGYMHLLPPSPHGVNSIPFSSTIIIGPSNPYCAKPSSDIVHVVINTQKMFLKLLYEDNSSLTLGIENSYMETKVHIKEVTLTNPLLPVLIYLSMWKEDGNADVDHISVNGDLPRHIMGHWKTLYGVSASFFRQCISNRNTLSPDIHIEIMAKNNPRYTQR